MKDDLWDFDVGEFDRDSFWLYEERTRWLLYGATSLVKGRATGYKFLSVEEFVKTYNRLFLYSLQNEAKDLPKSRTKQRRETGWLGVISRRLKSHQSLFVFMS